MGSDNRCAVVRVIRNRSNVPVHAEVLAENRVVRLAWFAALRKNGRWMNEDCQGVKVTYKVFDIFRKGKTQNCQHALEGILMVVDPIRCIQLKDSIGWVAHIRHKEVRSV